MDLSILSFKKSYVTFNHLTVQRNIDCESLIFIIDILHNLLPPLALMEGVLSDSPCYCPLPPRFKRRSVMPEFNKLYTLYWS